METEFKKIRITHFTTIESLSKDLGYDGAYVSRVERGLHPPSGKYFKDFMKYFGIEKGHPEYDRFIEEQKHIALMKVEEKYG